MKFLKFLFAVLLQQPALAAAASTDAWKSRSIYFALTDRIARNTGDNGGVPCGNLKQYCGGTFKGLESKLDYIQGMGFDAIWITPVVANTDGGYHGYWASDLYSINPKYGTPDDLKSLVNTAHNKGIFVMVDVVVNHMGSGSISTYKPAPLNDSNSYHADCNIDYSNQSSIEKCRIAGLPDINTERSDIRAMFQDWIRWLVKEFQFDGFRLDTVKHVEKDFFPGFVSAAGVYTIGEVFDGNPSYLAGYASLMPGLLDYAVYYPMNSFYQQKGSAETLVDMLATIDTTFPDPAALGTFLDNHDNPRWLNQKNDTSLLKNALAFVILSRGIPIVYYGTEQGYAGGADPANREDLWRSSFNSESDLYQTIKRLLRAKNLAGGLSANDMVNLYVTGNAYAWSRADGNLIVLTTNTGKGSSGKHCFDTKRPNKQWSSVFGGNTSSSDGNGNICLDVTNGEPIVLLSATGGTNPEASGTAPTSTSGQFACPTSVSVNFKHMAMTTYGETIKIAGNVVPMGNWDPAKAPSLSSSMYMASSPVWDVELKLHPGEAIQYKFIRVAGGGGVTWESGENRVYTVPTCGSSATVESNWR
ncbi:glycoside hydrolase [Westerdykella ornata]|uniref:Alpha-amylase n=1 Tax=Westerdykella ornata TaxID=318751 RepID=A0A6A6JT84_WESOR|nr:glycoside hydrolase [Westerdykella ornata]KAF2279782.1 glycoside hydrolase [Westerdykella ornata]